MKDYSEITNVPYEWVEETPHIIVGLRKDGIVHIYMKPNSVLDLNGAKMVVEIIGRLGGGKAYPNLLDPQTKSSINQKARAYSNSPKANLYTKADAILVKNVAHKIIGNAYMSFYNSGKPTKMFTELEKAEEWLKTFVEP